MAEEQKPVEVPKDETVVAEPVAPAPVEVTEETPAAPIATEATTAEPAAATEAATETPAAAAEEPKKEEEPTPVEDGHLEHKGSNFPKNFIYSKKYFWFGAEAVDPKTIPALLKDHHLAAWAAHTGKGLLFFSEKGDKTAPHGAIPLADATEPTTDGTNKFTFSAKGHKHTFKASSTAERDNWVAQLKAKIAEAKELAATVTESETYKKTLESFNPVAAKKEEKKSEEVAKPAEETPAAEAEAAAAPVTEAPKEEKKEEPKRRSASRKRASIFGNLLGGKKDEKKEEDKPAETTETPAAEPTTEVAAEAAPEAAAEPAVTPAEPTTEVAAPAETPAEAPAAEVKPTPTKRASIFGSLSFGKKKHEEATTAPVAKEAEPVSETAPVIPAPEPSEPISTAEVTEGAAPAEAAETPAVNGEAPKKDVKSDKRKSSLPALFGGKKEKAPAAEGDAEVAEKPKSPSPFSKLRATIKGSKAKTAEKPAEKAESTPEEGEAAKTEAEAPKADEETPAAAVPAAEETAPAVPAAPAANPVVTAAA